MIVWGGSAFRDNPGNYLNSGGIYDPATNTWTQLTTLGAPSARTEHTAVWTGARMIVWGGADSSSTLNSGASYDPATDSWTPITTAGAPSVRRLHTTVWTGARMIVWGGCAERSNCSSPLNSGASYDPATDTWAAITTAGAPTARARHTVVWTGTKMIVWGGSVGASSYDTRLNSGGLYDPATDTWTTTTTTGAPLLRAGHTAVWSGSKMVVWGGDSFVGGGITPPLLVFYDSGGIYDPTTNTWTTTGAAPARTNHTAVWTGTKMIVWGGQQYSGGLNSGGVYDPATDTWTAMATTGSASARAFPTSIWTGTEMVVWGGSDGATLKSGGIYRPATDTWTPMALYGWEAWVPTYRSRHTAVWTGSRMLVWGGSCQQFSQLDDDGSYDPSTDVWTPIGRTGAPSGRHGHTAVWTGTRMIVWGGDDCAAGKLNTGGIYDPATDTWTTLTTTGAPTARANHTAVWTGTRMIVWGGAFSNDSPNDGGIYDPATDTWTTMSTGNSAPIGGYESAVWTGTRMIVWGGLADHYVDYLPNYPRDARIYDPATDTWATTTTTGAPMGRRFHTAVWTGTRMLVWGGLGGTTAVNTLYFDSGAAYDPATDAWTPMTAAGAPTARYGHTAVWSGTKMAVWGGINREMGLAMNSGGLFDPATNTWTTMTTAGAPSGRFEHTAVWTGTAMVVWGGSASSGGTSASTLSTATGGVHVPPDADTTTTLASSPNPSSFCQPVALTATATPAIATGLVTFSDGTTALGTAPLGNGEATITTSALNAGTRSITAHYGGDVAFFGSTSPPLTQTVTACVLGSACDSDQDGIPDALEAAGGTQVCVMDNDVFVNVDLFVKQQYRDFLRREGEVGGIQYWAAAIAAGASRATVTKSFFDSPEFQGAIAPVARLYYAYFNRIPDLPGLQYWLDQYRAGMSLNDISQAFAGSAEFIGTYGSLSNSQFVTLVYQNVLGRAPDSAGLAYWTAQLNGGLMTRGQVLVGFSESSEYQQRSYNRTFVTMIYYGMLRRMPEQAGFDYWVEQLGAGASGLDLINGFLAASEYRSRFLP